MGVYSWFFTKSGWKVHWGLFACQFCGLPGVSIFVILMITVGALCWSGLISAQILFGCSCEKNALCLYAGGLMGLSEIHALVMSAVFWLSVGPVMISVFLGSLLWSGFMSGSKFVLLSFGGYLYFSW